MKTEEPTRRDVGGEAGCCLYGGTVPPAVREHTLARGDRLRSGPHNMRHGLRRGATQLCLSPHQPELHTGLATH